MKHILLLLSVMIISGCSTTAPVKQKFPEAPEILMQKCPDLETVEQPKVLLSELMRTVTRNYMKYHDCKNVVEGWHKWYNDQKKIFDEANSNK